VLAGAFFSLISAQPARAVDEIQVYNAGIAAPGQFTKFHSTQLYRASGKRIRRFPVAHFPWQPQRHAGICLWRHRLVGGRALSAFAVQDRQLLSDSSSCGRCFVSPNAEQRNFFYGVNF